MLSRQTRPCRQSGIHLLAHHNNIVRQDGVALQEAPPDRVQPVCMTPWPLQSSILPNACEQSKVSVAVVTVVAWCS